MGRTSDVPVANGQPGESTATEWPTPLGLVEPCDEHGTLMPCQHMGQHVLHVLHVYDKHMSCMSL